MHSPLPSHRTARVWRSAILWAGIPILAQSAIAQIAEAKLLAPDGLPGDHFGFKVALLPEWAFCSAPYDDNVHPGAGSIYVHHFDGSNWTPVQRLESGDPQPGSLGLSLAASGEWMVAGTPYDSSTGWYAAGAAHVFQLQGGAWVHAQKLLPSDHPEFYFGRGAVLSGDRMMLGANVASFTEGNAYVFELSGSLWVESAKLASSDAEDGDCFGDALAIGTDVAVVGARGEDNDVPGSDQGAAYVFEHSAGVWIQTQKLMAGDRADGDAFGLSVALEDDTLLVGSKHSHAMEGDGVMYVFERQGGSWIQTQEVLASDPSGSPRMGEFVALAGDLAVASAQADNDNGPNSGSAYVFRREVGGWVQIAKVFPPDAAPNSQFSNAVALYDRKLLVGCAGDDWPCLWNPNGCNAGSAYVFELAPDVEQFCDCPTQGPCGNHDDFGGCATHLRRGGVLSGAGSASVAADDLFLEASWMSYHSFGVLLMGDQAIQQPFGDGQLCVGSSAGGPWRFDPPQSSGLYGSFKIGPIVGLSSALPASALISAGQTRYFQAWFRDSMSLCGTDTNLTNAVRITFQP